MPIFFLVFLFTTMAGAITTTDQGDVIFNDGAVVYNDEVVDTGPIEPIGVAESFCDIGVQFSFRGNFQSLSGAQGFCRGFDDFCRTRRFSDRFYESNYRRRIVFRGRGNDRRGGRANAFNLYFDFINRGNFHNNRFNHQFFFSDNCS